MKTQGKIVLATVKGDVHDIGKNIVGVVLACNNYEVIDLGVMVPCEKILERAKQEKADIIGLSGLITPSLDEMVHVAREMERQGFKLPLLIGGATTSRAHTAVKIAPHYSEPVVHVLDASRAVPVTTSLLSDEGKPAFVAQHRAEYETLRKTHAAPQQQARLARGGARAAARRSSGAPRTCRRRSSPACACSTTSRSRRCASSSTGRRSSTPGNCGASTRDPRAREIRRAGAPALRRRATRCSTTSSPRSCSRRAASTASSRPTRVGDDVELYTDESRTQRARRRFHFLRQQIEKDDGEPNRSLARLHRAEGDRACPITSARFAVTTGIGLEELCDRFKAEHDDYNAIMAEALADRLAEAFAECLHKRVRDEWGYGRDEKPDAPSELIDEKYRGIRPAAGYPACPDHTEKGTLWQLLDVETNTGMQLTESFAMWPGIERERPLLRASRVAVLQPSARSTAIRSPTTTRARA